MLEYDSLKLNELTNVNKLLNITNDITRKLVFVYTAPKVGSTALVSSLRLFCIETMDIIHIHDEVMLLKLTNINSVSINEIIQFNSCHLKKDVYVINIFRSPIERKISTFFEKVGSYHFNNFDEHVNNYDVDRVTRRFNNIFNHLSNEDHFIDKYEINIPEKFDYINKRILLNYNNTKYIALRLKDSDEWSQILTNVFGQQIKIIKDYETSNKPIQNLFKRFKETYRIPINYLNETMNDERVNYYYSKEELTTYYNYWLTSSTSCWNGYTNEQYQLYQQITMENTHIDIIQLDHYFDEGCTCKACSLKRIETRSRIIRGLTVEERIIHIDAKNELIKKRVNRATKFNKLLSNLPLKRGKNFRQDMTNIVKNSHK
jgi:hypothetical protein